MYFDLEDYRPDTPRVPRAISAREGGLLSLVIHALLGLAIVFAPDWLARRPAAQAVVMPPQQEMRYVYIAPRVERPAPPRATPDLSDLDRRAATRERAPTPQNPLPFSRGTTPDKVDGAHEEHAAGPDAPTPPAPANTTPPAGFSETAPRLDTVMAPPAAPSGNLGASLRNLKRYLDDQSFDNQRGGQADQSADIQFDSKGADFGPWLRRFRNQVMRNWLVPEAAMWQRGRVVLQFFVLRNGTIIDVRVLEASSIDAFTLAAATAIKLSNPTADLPADYPADRVFFTVTFHYNEGQR